MIHISLDFKYKYSHLSEVITLETMSYPNNLTNLNLKQPDFEGIKSKVIRLFEHLAKIYDHLNY